MKIISKLMLLVSMLTTYISFGQTKPDQTYDLGAKINEMTLTGTGTLIVATNDGISGISVKTSKPLFNFTEFGAIKTEEMEFVPLSPYVIVAQGEGKGPMASLSALTGTKRGIIDHVSGRVIFKTDDLGWKQIFTFDVILPQNKLVISGLQKDGNAAEKNTPKVAVYDLSAGKLDYSFFLNEPGKVTAKYFAVTGKPLLLKSSLIVPTSQGLISKNLSGKTLWENKIKNIGWMVADDSEKEIYAFEPVNNGSNTRIHKVGSNGAELWQDDRKVKGTISNFEILDNGLAVVSDQSGNGGVMSKKNESNIAFLDASNGEDLWVKAPKTKGYVQHFYTMEDGILFGIYEGGINKISYDGKTLFKKPLKTGENIQIMAHTPQGLIYITDEDANIVNLETGEQVWNKPLTYKKAAAVASVYDEKNSQYLISADDKIYAVEESTGDISDFGKFDFEEKEQPNHMEIRDNGVFLSSSQNVAMFGANGDELFHEYYKSPSNSGFLKVAAGVMAVASTALAMASSARAGANKTGFGSSNDLKNYNDYGKEAKRAADMFAGIGDASFEVMSQRFKASSATENDQFILTRLDGGTGLVKVNKDSGKVEKEIVLQDKKPEYKVDEFGGVLYYKANNSSIYAYDLSK
ncbi:PQQ-binding-like beta-propeller repeat protein [uncultured Christiangramia sp.]|uniref:outer membrane protein assembly factor BamB family protein n=1 Tax=uncultured Christiangramia sp. TaxID=503836 RepID=UPI00260607FB|nr:PQQ-binding-like beta-propeller repeat protein [uncultured Christiangramia sp.]